MHQLLRGQGLNLDSSLSPTSVSSQVLLEPNRVKTPLITIIGCILRQPFRHYFTTFQFGGGGQYDTSWINRCCVLLAVNSWGVMTLGCDDFQNSNLSEVNLWVTMIAFGGLSQL